MGYYKKAKVYKRGYENGRLSLEGICILEYAKNNKLKKICELISKSTYISRFILCYKSLDWFQHLWLL